VLFIKTQASPPPSIFPWQWNTVCFITVYEYVPITNLITSCPCSADDFSPRHGVSSGSGWRRPPSHLYELIFIIASIWNFMLHHHFSWYSILTRKSIIKMKPILQTHLYIYIITLIEYFTNTVFFNSWIRSSPRTRYA